MSDSVKAFQYIQKFHQIIGIFPFDSNEKQSSINLRKAIFLFGNVQFVLPMIAYLVLEAELMFDYGIEFYFVISTVNCIAVYVLFIWQRENTFKFIETCKRFIVKSKCLQNT